MQGDAAPAFERLCGIIRRLRAPDGCPWDLAQTPSTLRASLVEEAWECVSAVDARDEGNLEEELGDLYMLVTMIAWMKEQEGAFTVESALGRICEKLVRRHPHVFGGPMSGSIEETATRWEEIKTDEKGGVPAADSVLDHLPGSLPPLEKAFALQVKAAKVGFDWGDAEPVWGKLSEEIAELREAVRGGDTERIEGELGDLLFTAVNLARQLKADPGVALHGANEKFERRFREVEKRIGAQGTSPGDAGLARLDAIWNQVKSEE